MGRLPQATLHQRLDRARLLPTFRESFSDYAMDVSGVTEEMKRIRATKNNVDWDVSVGVFDSNRMVAFTLIAVDDWQGRLTAFDATTGVVPEHRGRRLAGRMLEHAMPALRRRGVTRFVLEEAHRRLEGQPFRGIPVMHFRGQAMQLRYRGI